VYPERVEDLKGAPYNPRTISEEALEGLKASLAEFGDISGLVWNRRTGRLVAGHQRVRALRERYGDGLRIIEGSVVTPAGERFPIRVVDWPEEREKAANLAANSPLLAGEFTAEVGALIAAATKALPEASAALRLPEIEVPEVVQPVDLERTAPVQRAPSGLTTCPKCGFVFGLEPGDE